MGGLGMPDTLAGLSTQQPPLAASMSFAHQLKKYKTPSTNSGLVTTLILNPSLQRATIVLAWKLETLLI